MSGRRLFHYATWAAFMVTGTLFVTSWARSVGDSGNGDRHSRPAAHSDHGFKLGPLNRESNSARRTPIHVDVYEFGFSPSNTIIKAGQAIAYRNVGKQIHNIVPMSEPAKRYFEEAARAGSSRPIFPVAGVYPFACSVHPQMRGTVTVVNHF
jgi:plastocyanin